MPITIKGIKVNDVHIKPTDIGGYKIETAEYSLISSVGKVLAKQTIGGYNGMALEPSSATQAALDVFMQSYTKDMQALLGLLDEPT